jgi:hypothetical protein
VTTLPEVKYTADDAMVNAGVPVETRKFGTVAVKELTIEHVQLLAREVVQLLLAVGEKDMENLNEHQVVMELVMAKETVSVLKALLAAGTGRDVKDFDGLPLSDSVKLVKGFLAANPLGDLKELFFQLVPALRPGEPEPAPSPNAT